MHGKGHASERQSWGLVKASAMALWLVSALASEWELAADCSTVMGKARRQGGLWDYRLGLWALRKDSGSAQGTDCEWPQ